MTCWFQAAVLGAANSHWPLTSAGSLCWNWGELNFYWLVTTRDAELLLVDSPGCLSLRRRGRSCLGSLLEASCDGVFSEGEGAARSPGHRAGGGTGSGTQFR